MATASVDAVLKFFLKVQNCPFNLALRNHIDFLYSDSNLFISTEFKHFIDKYIKLGDNEKTVWSPESAATLPMIHNSIIILHMPIKFVNLEIFQTNILFFSKILTNVENKKHT